ncbi:uncharacterized protein ccdc142 isoform X1 [Perca fluviatilis]|nr:uncharacterized protein ccdc142 isoform X1 [Perca fluviatilis]XP_039670209.1 uncharacterized protein ccdc142 isoform X1 [Perca fluviatilis]XP_039670210.1 uncharacterized protein ccdc142 isoform X1 [Perca fluviatilis]XP_039670211.1 uncharacterized protein ccdc142 isoform X1 [Perca fluviatilis]
MDHNNPEILEEPGGETAERENSKSECPEKEQTRCSSCMVAEDLTPIGSWSQSSISRSLQRAETILRSTFNPSLKWLFHGRSQDEEEEHFVAAANLVSRSSARLLRLQQALLTVSPQWQLVGGAQPGSHRVCVKGLPAEGGVLLLPSSPSLQGHYTALRRLLEQRCLLLFVHEYTRRARLTAAYISRVSHLLEGRLKKPHLTPDQTPSSWSSTGVGLGSLSQELRVHLNHWSCLLSKVQSDHYLRPALVQQTRLLAEIKQTVDLLGLQALVLMEHYVYVILSAIAQTELDSVPREVLEDILTGTALYNQAVGEQRAQHSTTQLRTAVLQQTHCSTLDFSLPKSFTAGHHPAAFSVKELMMVLAVQEANAAAKQLLCWATEQSSHTCQVHTNHESCACSENSVSQGVRLSCGASALRSEWTWEQLQHTYLISSPLFPNYHHPPLQSSSRHTCHKTAPVYVPDLHLDGTIFENHYPVLAKPTFVQHRPDGSVKDQTSQCQTNISQTCLAQTNVEALAQPNLETQTSLGNCKLLRTVSPPSTTFRHLLARPLSGGCQQDHSSVELLFQVLVSSNDLLAPLVSRTSTPEAPSEQLLPNTGTDVLSPNGKNDLIILNCPIINAAGSVECNRLSTEVNKEQKVEGPQQEWHELEITTRKDATVSSGFGSPEKEETGGAEGTTAEPDCLRWPHSVQWLDLGQSLVFAELFGQYRTLLWTLCSKALWLQLHVPQAGSAAGSINLQDKHRGFQILHRISQASKDDLVAKECRTMLEDFSLYLLVITAHAQWDYVVCRSLGSALKDKCLTDVNQGSHSVTMGHFLLLSPPLLSSLCCHRSNSRASGSTSLFPSRLTLQRQTVSLALATVQLSTVWVMSKAYQFLSSWSLNKFLLITQGDLKVLMESLEMTEHQTDALVMNSDMNQHSTLHIHNQLLLRQQLNAFGRAVSELQTFSSLVLKNFSSDCKRMSAEIFEQTMPSAVHWRHSLRTGFPSSPSEYASVAAQTVIGQVLEGVAPLSDDARVQALSITMTAFMEAWMEHILKQKIKFSVQGALQLKHDFDSIRELIQSDAAGLSAELHQRLLSLRVFQQVDSAVVCLLQQPPAKPYLQPRAWEPFTRCCPTNGSRDSVDTAVGSSITNLRCMEGEDLTQADASDVTTDLPPVDPSTPGEPYLAPSLALGVTQREWLDLRIHSSVRRWRLPGLPCLSKSEP